MVTSVFFGLAGAVEEEAWGLVEVVVDDVDVVREDLLFGKVGFWIDAVVLVVIGGCLGMCLVGFARGVFICLLGFGEFSMLDFWVE